MTILTSQSSNTNTTTTTTTDTNTNTNTSKRASATLEPMSRMSNCTHRHDNLNFNSTNNNTGKMTNNSKRQRVSMLSHLVLIISISYTQLNGKSVDAKSLNSPHQLRFRRVPPKEFSAALGSSITIECESAGTPPATIHWLRDGKRIVQSDLDENHLDDGLPLQVDLMKRTPMAHTRSRLSIDCADFQDEAVYTCVAETPFSRISAHTRLNLIKPASLQSSGSSNDLLNGPLDDAELTAAGDSSALKSLDQTTGGTDDSKSLSAVPQCLSERTTEPARIYMWTPTLVGFVKTDVVVMCRANIKIAKQQRSVTKTSAQDLFGSQSLALSGALATDATLDGSSGGKTKHNRQLDNVDNGERRVYVSWTRAVSKGSESDVTYKQLMSGVKHEVLETGDLLIKDLSPDDMGQYVCTVSDDQGSDTVDSFVYPTDYGKENNKRAASLYPSRRFSNNFNR